MSEATKTPERGETERALGAAHEAQRLGRHVEAGRHFLAAQRPWEAAVCFQKGQALKDCLEALLLVQRSSSDYRQACVHATRVAALIGEPLTKVANFALQFLITPPTSPAEASAMKEIADAVAASGRPDFARGVYQRVLAVYPGDEEAKETLATLPMSVTPPAQPKPPQKGATGEAHRYVPATQQTGAGKRLGELLVAKGLVEPLRLKLLIGQEQKLEDNDIALGDTLVANGFVTETTVLQALSELSKLPYIGEARLLSTVTPDLARYLPVEKAEAWKVVPVALIGRQLHFALKDPRDIAAMDRLRFASGVGHVSGVFASEGCIRKGILKIYHGENPEPELEEALWDRSEQPVEVTRFSDRFTRTREQEFDTTEFDKSILDGAEPEIERTPGGFQESTSSSPSGLRTAPPMSSPSGLRAAPPMSSPSGLRAAPPASGPSGLHQAHAPKPGSGHHPPVPESRGSGAYTPVPPSSPTIEVAPGQVPVPNLMPGTVIANRYQVLGLLGQGGTALVYRAVDTELNEPVAIKLFGHTVEEQSTLARYKLELSLSRQLTHPNIIRLFDLGAHEGWRYLSMELLEGTDLATLISSQGPLPVAQGLDYLVQACLGLQAAHDRGVIHRDVKPQNLFITRDGVVKVMDFGLAKKDRAPSITVQGMIAGTPEYMSPEQINGFSTVTFLTDIYALGATAYSVFTGEPPFLEDGLVALLMAQAQRAPEPMRHRNPSIPSGVDDIVLKMLEKDPARRPQGCAEVAAALRQILAILPATRG